MWHYSVAIRIRTRLVKTLYTTGFAKEVFGYVLIERVACQVVLALKKRERFDTELQKSCGYAGTTREEGLPCVRSLRKVSTFNQQISAKSAETRNFE